MPVYRHHYGIVLELERPLNDLELELYCFRSERKEETGRLPKAQHLRNIVAMLWGPKTNKEFIWHPWAEKMLEESCDNKYLAVLGPGNGGKTDFFAVWAIVNWMAAPAETKVMVTSTSLKESRKRIWGSIRQYYMAVPGLPGKLVDSLGIIRTMGDDGKVLDDKCGIELIPGERKKEKDAIGKMIGIKAKRIILIADEMPELSEAILNAFVSNLSLNPYSRFIGIGNFSSIYDALGIFATPLQGYANMTPDDLEWETRFGKCIRFDGIRSPNILEGRDIYPFIFNNKDLKEMRVTMKETSREFWRMVRSFPCPESVEDVIYTDADFLKGRANETPVWMGHKEKIAFLDPAFTSDGDRSIACFGSYGMSSKGQMIVALEETIEFNANLDLKDQPETHQIAAQFREACIQRRVKPENAGYDSTTGGGIVLGEIFSLIWSDKLFGMQFGGAPSDMQVSLLDERTAKDAYMNRVTEIWYSAYEFLRFSQLKGITNDVAKELKARKYQTFKSTGLKTKVESKKEMKKRLGFSPDKADAFLGMVMVVKERLGGMPGEGGQISFGDSTKRGQFDAVQKVAEAIDYSEDNMIEYLDYAETA